MHKSTTLWGVGPRIALYSIPYAIIVSVIHVIFPAFEITFIPYPVFVIMGIILISIGVLIWISTGTRIPHIFNKGVLATQGWYGIMRHPFYAQFILFTGPGILMFFNSWLLFTIPVFTYMVFTLLIREEEASLEKRFGETCLKYKQDVNAVFPTFSHLVKAFFYPLESGRITDNLYAVKTQEVNMFICTYGKNAIAFDSGYSDSSVTEEFEKLPLETDNVSHVFLTHSDNDHAGGLECFAKSRIYMGREEESLINGKKARGPWFVHNRKIKREYILLDDRDVVKIGDLIIEAIAVPGHTLGHMCYLLNNHILFTGDALILQNGNIYPFYRLLNMNTKLLRKSVKKLESLPHVSLICTAHTGCLNIDHKRHIFY